MGESPQWMQNPTNRYEKLSPAAWNVRTTNDCQFSPSGTCNSNHLTWITKCSHICAISKVRREGINNLIEKEFTFYWSGGDKKKAGVCFAVSNLLSNVHLDISNISERLMTLRIQLKSGNHLKLISAYAPTMQQSQEKELFYSQLLDAIKTNSDDHLIILDNFNARVGCDWALWPNVLGKHGVGRMNSNGLMLFDFCTQNDLSVMGSMYQMKNSLKTTWKHPRSKHCTSLTMSLQTTLLVDTLM